MHKISNSDPQIIEFRAHRFHGSRRFRSSIYLDFDQFKLRLTIRLRMGLITRQSWRQIQIRKRLTKCSMWPASRFPFPPCCPATTKTRRCRPARGICRDRARANVADFRRTKRRTSSRRMRAEAGAGRRRRGSRSGRRSGRRRAGRNAQTPSNSSSRELCENV